MLTSHLRKPAVSCALLLVWTTATIVHAQSAPRAGDRTFDADNPSQPIEGHTTPPDIVFRREGPVEIGHLQSLLAFATLFDDDEILQQRASATAPADGEGQSTTLPATTPSDERPGLPGTHVPRDEIGLILLDGKSFPAEPPAMPPDEDSVLLDSGEVLTGLVMVTGGEVYVAGQTVPGADVTVIRLKSDGDPMPVRTPPPPPPPPPPVGLPDLPPYWVGTIALSLSQYFDDPRHHERQVEHWYMGLKEEITWEDQDSRNTDLNIQWAVYVIEIDLQEEVYVYDPNPYRVRRAYILPKNKYEHNVGTIDYLTPEAEKQQIEIENRYPEIQPERNGSYWLRHPSLNGDEQNWPKRRRWLRVFYPANGQDVIPLALQHWGTPASYDEERLNGRPQIMVDGLMRMRGEQHDINLDDANRIDFAQWDLRRVDHLPPPPEVPEQEEEDEDACFFYRQQLEENQTDLDVWQSQLNWLKLIRGLIMTRQEEEQLREELDGLRYAVWEARINSEYYEQKLAECEAAQADADASESPLEPEPDLRGRLQEYYGLDPE